MLTGVKPFRGKSITEIMSFMETRGPEDIHTLNPAVPESLKRVIARALAFDSARRYPNADAFGKAVAAAISSPAGPPSAPAQEGSSPSSEGPLPPNLLRGIERDLATFIGPMASIAVRRAARQTGDPATLYELLAKQLDNPEDRARFLAKTRRLSAVASDRTVPSAPLEPTGGPRQKPQDSVGVPRRADIVAIEASLTRYIGPIARILIKRELEKFETLDKFYLVLAAHIPDERDRKAFLAGQGGR
jgi:serine/threonine-protein kinase